MRPLPALACLALLAGCLGYPPGAARLGDTVAVRYVATDPATGAVLDENGTTFVAGEGMSGLGMAVEQAVVGHGANETLRLRVRLVDTVEVPQLLSQRARIQTYNTSAFSEAVGPPTVGLAFHAYGYNATLTAVTPANVTFALTPMDGQRQEHPEVGLALAFSSRGDTLVETLEPTPGATFAIDAQHQLGLRAVGPHGFTPLQDGTYRVLPASGGYLRFAHTTGSAALLDHDVSVAVTVVSVQASQAAPPAAANGEYGRRNSPQVLGDASGVGGNLTAAP